MKPSSAKHSEWELAMGLIRIGMTAGEVATILGHASRDIFSGEE